MKKILVIDDEAWLREMMLLVLRQRGFEVTEASDGESGIEQARKELPGLHERVLARTPAARWGVPEDFAGIAIFLASRASDFVTGTAIPVDGGYSAQA